MIIKIKKGNHFSNKRFPFPFIGKSMQRFVVFNQTAIYKTNDPVNMHDVNKLFGFAEVSLWKLIAVFFKGIFGGGIFEEVHHINSARTGFSRPDGRLWLSAYCYANRVREVKPICPLEICTGVMPIIKCEGKYYFFYVETTKGLVMMKMNRGVDHKRAYGFKLNTYFGGDETAPHDILIFMKRKKTSKVPKSFRPLRILSPSL